MAKTPTPVTEETVELYVLGGLAPDEALELEARAMNEPKLRKRIESLRDTMERVATHESMQPPSGSWDTLLERISEIEENRPANEPPFLNAASRPEDFVQWMAPVLRELVANTDDLGCMKIGRSEDTVTYLAKMCTSIPEEVHTHDIERILIVEGTCEFQVGDERYPLGPGDHFTIPLHRMHSAERKGDIPCIFIVQRTRVSE